MKMPGPAVKATERSLSLRCLQYVILLSMSPFRLPVRSMKVLDSFFFVFVFFCCTSMAKSTVPRGEDNAFAMYAYLFFFFLFSCFPFSLSSQMNE